MTKETAPIGSLWIEGPLSWLERASIASFVQLGHDYVLYSYGAVPNVPAGAELRDAREVWENDQIIRHEKAGSPAIHADVFRALMARDTGRVWVDTDVIALRPFPAALDWYLGWERSDRPILGNAILGCPAESRTIGALCDFLTGEAPIPAWFSAKRKKEMAEARERGEAMELSSLSWGTTGPTALTHFARECCEIGYAQPQQVFFPISFPERKRLVDPRQIGAARAQIERDDCLSVHLYSRWLRKYAKGRPPSRDGWLGDHLIARGLIDPAEIPARPAKGPKSKPERLPDPDPERFLAELDERKSHVPRGANVSRHGRVVCVSMAKDEGPYLLEWVAHHHLLGFTDLLVFTNDCSDGTDEMLDALAGLGLVTRVENGPMGSKPPQSRALKRAQKHPLVQDADWLMVMDFDEFLTIRAGDGRIDALIDEIAARKAGAMAVTWRFFGSAGQSGYADAPVTQRLTRAAPDGFSKGFGVKTLFRNRDYLRLAIHRPRIQRKANLDGRIRLDWINGSGERIDGQVMSWRQTRQTAGYGLAQVNHYGVKSGEEYLMRRLRGDVLNNHGKYDADYFRRFDCNEIEDLSAAAGAAELRGFCAELLKHDAVAQAARLIETRLREKLARLRAAPDYAQQISLLGF